MYYQKPKRRFEYFLPFFILICIGVVLVLVIQLILGVGGWGESGEADVYLYLDTGRAKVQSWGDEGWNNAYHGMRLLEGDSVRVLAGGRAVLSFFDGTWLRLDDGSELTLNTIEESKMSKIEVSLEQGRLWANKGRTEDFTVHTANLRILPKATVLEVEFLEEETVRVFSGKVNVEIVSGKAEEATVLESMVVGVGQQIEIGAEEMAKLAFLTEGDLLEAVSEDFKETEWYKWNMIEDQSPTDFSIRVKEDFPTEPVEPTESEQPEIEEEIDEPDLIAPEVTITYPEDNYQLEEQEIVIEGTTSADTEKVKITAYIGNGEVDEYVLQGYLTGQTEWRYKAAFKYKNLSVGRNRYQVQAWDAAGNKSDVSEVVIEVPESVEQKPVPAPEVVSFNGKSSNVTEEDQVKVVGKVGEGISKIYVNGAALTKYVPGSGEFVFYVAEQYKNFKCGNNYFEIYAEDEAGNKSEAVKATIVRLCLGE